MDAAGRAVVIGGSVAGLAAAAALAPRAGEVVIVERRPVPTGDAAATSIVAHGGFPHVLLAGGAAALERLVPGLIADLFAHGAVGANLTERRCHWWAGGAVRSHLPEIGVPVPMCSRALVETRLRAHVLRLPNVVVADGLVVRGVRMARGRVDGVDAEAGGEPVPLGADLVVDASGRGSRAPAWLEAAGSAVPRTSRVEVGVTYTALDVRRHPSDLDGALFAVVQNAPALARIGVALPAEGDRWKIVLGGYFGDAAPTTRDGLLDFAASLPDPTIRELLANEWLTEPAQHRFPSSQRRHWEKVRRLPAGFCAVGDAVASFNPLYGQGMSAAALQAEALGSCLDRTGPTPALPRAVARAAGRVVANPWQIATGADFIYRQTSGPKPPGTDLVNRYMARVFVAAAADEAVNLALTRVQQLLAAPPTLFAPAIVRRVAKAHRQTSRSLAAAGVS